MNKQLLGVTLLCLVSGCSRPRTDLGSLGERRNPAVQTPQVPSENKRDRAINKAPMPISVEVGGIDQQAVFGKSIPLSITIRNSAKKVIWVNENGLPWTDFRSIEVLVESPFLAATHPIADSAETKWKRLEPGDQLQGQFDISGWLRTATRPYRTESVRVAVTMTIRVSEFEPDQLRWRILELEVGRLNIDVPPNDANE